MSGLWTPDGSGSTEPDIDDTEVSPEEILAETRARLAEVPPEMVVANHAMGLYELGAIHLSAPQPDLAAAALAIDAFACLVEGLGDRIGPDSPTLVQALAQIRLAFVQIKGSLTEP